MNHAPSVAIGQIVATITKPRTVYDFSLNGTPTTGTPVYTSTGELLGFCMIHPDDGGPDPAKLRAMMSGGAGNEVLILPAGEVASLVDSARKAAAKKENQTRRRRQADRGSCRQEQVTGKTVFAHGPSFNRAARFILKQVCRRGLQAGWFKSGLAQSITRGNSLFASTNL